MRILRTGESSSHYDDAFQETDEVVIPTKPWDSVLVIDASGAYKNGSTKKTVIRIELTPVDILNALTGYTYGRLNNELDSIKKMIGLQRQIFLLEEREKRICHSSQSPLVQSVQE